MEETKKSNQDDLDLTSILKIIWDRRRLLIWSISVSLILGFIISLLSPNEYLSKTTIIRESQEPGNRRGFSRLASLAGFSSNAFATNGELSTAIYPEVLKSRPFQKGALKILIDSEKYGNGITLRNYLLYNDDAKPHKLIKSKIKYIIMKLFGDDKTPSDSLNERINDSFIELSSRERRASKLLSEVISISTDQETGAISIECYLNEPEPSAIVANYVREKLEFFIQEHKTRKVREEVDFLQRLFKEKKDNYEKSQRELANYKDAHRVISSSLGLTEAQSLEDKNRLSFALYNQVATELENKKIELQENKPIFTVIQPVILPRKPASPNHIKAIFLSLFVGGFIGMSILFFLEVKIYVKSKWP